MIKNAKGAAEADVALLNSVFAFLVDHRDVAIEFCAYLVGNQRAEREKAIFGLKGIVCSAMCDADAEPES